MDMQLSCNTFITFIELQEALLLMHVNDSFVCQLFLRFKYYHVLLCASANISESNTCTNFKPHLQCK